MPKIPVFTTQARPTAEVGGIKSNVQAPIPQFAGGIQQAVTDYYVKEKTIEANNKATKILSDLYIDQKDENGKTVSQGLFSIQSKASSDPNPSNASKNFDEEINKLWDYTKNSKLSDADNFLKKAIQNKFSATAGMFKIKALEGSRASQLKETTKVTNDFVVTDSFALKTNGLSYLDVYKTNIDNAVDKLINLDDGERKTLKNNYIAFGQKQLAADLALNSPEFFKQNINKFDFLKPEEKIKILKDADEQILKNNQAYFTSDMNLTEDTTANNIVKTYEGIVNQTFNGDIDKIKKWETLSSSDKASILDHAKKVRRQNTAELNNRNTAILNQNKDKSINDFRKIFENSKTLDTISLLEINKVFGEPKNDYEKNAKSQIIELSTKIGQKEFSNVNNYYKNFNIQKAILSGQVKDHITPFALEGETEAKSITQRVGEGISKQEFGFYINYLLPNSNNKEFIDNHKKLYNKIESFQTFVEGPSSLKYLDTTLDNRLNNFQSEMIFNFISGIKNGIQIDDMLNPKNKNFIGKNWKNYQPDKDYITKILSEKSSESSNKESILPPQWSPNKYKTVDDWLNSKEYKEYLVKKNLLNK